MSMQDAAQRLRQAEMTVARLTGELQSLETQAAQSRAVLETYGIDPEKAQEALAELLVQEQRLGEEVERLTAALNEALT